ncbi:putative 2-oxoglutarate-dependent dioxygenase [Gracilariopsis chorda]|uniref:Putative 2-oxoglutarate-dependent dioxygenase n=1 Tax=Gracilariopsis chorda TaxID=448386 RepID=A0A2V3IXS5_9FLOR|nr:putative 2-oxoglutarate-dependent dioxygenase [Gracilariopsis chorda]|eukprot:PXF46863.1 putative 2-oxoglutarate-dependent dioxygenase [Gracilariopsis chorda]
MERGTRFPIIEVSALFGAACGDDRERLVGEELKTAFEGNGMAYLRFDGESQDMLQRVISPAMQSLKAFFAQPAHEKQKSVCTELPPGVTRGYLAPAAESGSDAMEWKEGYSWSCEWVDGKQPSNSFEAYNVWAENQPHMQERLGEAFEFMHKLVTTLTKALMKALDDFTPDLESMCVAGKSISLMRGFHYFERDELRKATGSSPHTDWGFMTLVAQEDATENALQVYVNGIWENLPPIPNTLVVNCSDFLSLITKGRLRSPLHRVVLTSRERTSLVYFQYPGYDTCMPSTTFVEGMSILKDQSAGANGIQLSTENLPFGDFIARKWAQVNRVQ